MDKFKPYKVKPEKICPSAIFDSDSAYETFLDNILVQTNYLSMTNRAAFFIGANCMFQKKLFHDFLMETKRRFIESQEKTGQ